MTREKDSWRGVRKQRWARARWHGQGPSASRAGTDAHWLEQEIVLRLCMDHSLTRLVPRLQRARLETGYEASLLTPPNPGARSPDSTLGPSWDLDPGTEGSIAWVGPW